MSIKGTLYGDIITISRDFVAYGYRIVICHQVNCVPNLSPILGVRIGEVFPSVKESYLSGEWKLGDVQILEAEPCLYVASLVVQKSEAFYKGQRTTRHKALKTSLGNLREWLKSNEEVTLLIPSGFACGNNSGDWSAIKPLLEEGLKDFQVFLVQWNKEGRSV